MEKQEILENSIKQAEKNVNVLDNVATLLYEAKNFDKLPSYPAIAAAIIDSIYSKIACLVYDERKRLESLNTELTEFSKQLTEMAEEIHAKEAEINSTTVGDDLPF